MSLAMRKCVLCHMQTTKAHISLSTCTVILVPLLFFILFVVCLFIFTNFKVLVGLFSRVGLFQCELVKTPKHISFLVIRLVCIHIIKNKDVAVSII